MRNNMRYTNIYLGFLKIKADKEIQKRFGQLEGLEGRMGLDANRQIKNFIADVYNAGRKENVTDISTAKNIEYSQYLKIVNYGGYKFLYVVYSDWCVWINYEKQGIPICKPGTNCLWDYIPNLESQSDKCVCTKGEVCYIVNTYIAFIVYVDEYLVKELSKDDNDTFFGDVKKMLAAYLPDYFYIDNQKLYCRMRVPEGIKTFLTAMGDKSLSMTFLFIDNMVIVLDCHCVIVKKITVLEQELPI